MTETKLKKEHAFCSMVMQKNILTEFINFLGSDNINKDMISTESLEKFKTDVLEPQMEYYLNEAKEVGIPFDLYLDLLPLPVMDLKMINRYMNDINMFIDWCHSE